MLSYRVKMIYVKQYLKTAYEISDLYRRLLANDEKCEKAVSSISSNSILGPVKTDIT